MRALEHWIACEVVGSKTSVERQGLYSIAELRKSNFSQSLLEVCDMDHCVKLAFLKKQGDMAAHRLPSKQQLREALSELEDDPEQLKLALDLVDMLDRYCEADKRPFGWDPLANEKINKTRLQIP